MSEHMDFDSWPEEAQDSYRAQNEKLWRLVRAINPAAAGHIGDFLEPAWERAIRHRHESEAYRTLIKIVDKYLKDDDQ